MASPSPDDEAAAHRVVGMASGRGMHRARPALSTARRTAAVLGGTAVVAAVGVGSFALVHAPDPVPSTPSSAQYITVTPTVPLPESELLALLRRPPDYGPLTAPGRRAACLTGLGYRASTRVLAARPIEVQGHPGILLMVPGADDAELSVVVVAPNCSAADTGLLAQTTVSRPTTP